MIPSSLYCHACGAANATDSSVCFACKQPLQIAANENTALLQDRYRILTQVGKGGFGAVYRAEDTKQRGNIVAIKQINLRGLTPQETIEATDAFNREVSLLSHLSHPNLPRIYDNFTDPEHWYLVMDFINGETLETYLDAKEANYTASLNEVLTLGMQLCTVLDYLHTREPSIIFRDLKPANIMRTPSDKLYLIDFGIARSFKPGKLKDTIPFGSPGYAAPEQYGKVQTTPRADIYSLGALLHMLLSGDDPVDNPFHFSPLRIYGVSGLTDLEVLIMRMVQLDVNKRPTTVAEVKDELQRIANLQDSPRLWRPPVGQTPPALPTVSSGSGQQQISISGSGQQQLYMPRTQRTQLARRKFIIGGLSIAGLTIIGASGIANIVSALRPGIDGMYTGPDYTQNQSLFGRTHTYTGNSQPVQDIVWSQDNKFLASASDDGSVQIWTVDKATGVDPNPSDPVSSHTSLVPATYLSWGQDNMLAFNSGTTITLWDTLRGTTTSVTPALNAHGADVSLDINRFAWSPDRTRIVFPTREGVQIWDVGEKKVVQHIDFMADQTRISEAITSLSWSSDVRYIAVGSDETMILDVSEGQIATRLSNVGNKYVTWSPDGTYLATVAGNIVDISFLSGDRYHTSMYTLSFDVTALAWSADSKYIVAASLDAKIHVWSPTAIASLGKSIPDDTSPFTTIIDTQGTAIHSLAWSDDESYIAIGADKAYLLEINTPMLQNQGRQDWNEHRRRRQ